MTSLTSILQDVFADKLLIDDREPSFTILNYVVGDTTYQLDWYNPKSDVYVQFGLLFVANMIFAALMGALVYQTIVLPMKQQQKQKQTNNVTTPILLLTFGVLVPICMMLPFWIMDYLNVQSRAVRFATAGSAATMARIVATAFGFAPDYATHSQTNMMVHFGSLLELKWNDKTKTPLPATTLDKRFVSHHILHGTIAYVFMIGLFSWMAPYDFLPFASPVNSTDFMISFDPNHLANTFCVACLLSMFLSSASHMIGAFYPLLMGYEVELLVNNPMFMSSSPSDFWGRRWNSLGHILLKRGFYKPARCLTGSAMMGALSAFIASGLIHEWVSYVMFHTNSHEATPSGYHFPIFGKQMGFFGWNGILVMMEYIIVANGIAKKERRWMSQHLPKVTVGILVVLTALPTGHWMTSDLVALDFAKHLSLGFPKLVLSSTTTKTA